MTTVLAMGLALLSMVADPSAVAVPANATEIFVAPGGNDAWSGRVPAATPGGTDGPLATFAAARDRVREMRKAHPETPVVVGFLQGVYRTSEPITLTPEDSGSVAAPIVYRAYPGNDAPAVISGGRRIAGWRQEGRYWVADIAEVKSGDWVFSALWVNGRRCTIARTPNEGYLFTNNPYPTGANLQNIDAIQGENHGFYFANDDIRPWHNLEDALVVVYHTWETSEHRIKSIDEAQHYVEFVNPAIWKFEPLGTPQRYHVENILEALDAPGEWYLDRSAGKVYYIPRAGEDMATATVIAPVAKQLVILAGDPANGKYVEHVTFSGLHFRHTEYAIGPNGHTDAQAATSVPAAIQADGARFCTVERCEVAQVGGYGIHFRSGCEDNAVSHCELRDLGAGGVRIGAAGMSDVLTQRNVVDNNFIHDGGKTFRSGVGVWIGQAAYNRVSHNEVCDLLYSGMSIGWTWGYLPNQTDHNLIEYNYIHDIGKGVMSDMGGIYTLGSQSGTVLQNNLIHDVHCFSYGGWGIYPDEGSTGMLIQNNVVYNTTSGGFHLHYGKENRVRNNIFAAALNDQINATRPEKHLSTMFEHNIVVTDNGRVFQGSWSPSQHRVDHNCYWDVNGTPMRFTTLSFDRWQAEGFDRHSICADPKLKDLKKPDFALKKDSPALAMGFNPIDTRQIGLYGEKAWVKAPKRIKREGFTIPKTPNSPMMRIHDDFESTAVGDKPLFALLWGESDDAYIRVTDEQACTGAHALKFTDNDPETAAYNPEMAYQASIAEGVAVTEFDLFLTPGASLRHDLRGQANVDTVGPLLMFAPDGDLVVQGDTLMRVPTSAWMHIATEWPVGKNVTGTYTLSVTLPDGTVKRFPELKCVHKDCDVLVRAFFSSYSNLGSSIYLDNISIDQR